MSASQTKGFPFSEKKCHEVTKGDGVVNLLSAKHNAINDNMQNPPTFCEELFFSLEEGAAAGGVLHHTAHTVYVLVFEHRFQLFEFF